MRTTRILCLLGMSLVLCVLPAWSEDANQKRIAELNASTEKNREARSELVRAGDAALPALLQEISGYRYLNRDSCLHAARALRVVREMGSDKAVPVCVDILSFVPGQGENQDLLLNEALDYLFTYFRDLRSRDAYYDLLRNRESTWLTGERDFVRLFILNGIAPMAENKDPRVDDILVSLIKKLPYVPTKGPGDVRGRWTVTAWLGTDGFSRQGCKNIAQTFGTRTERGPSCFYDPYYRERMLDAECRYRIACLQLAKEYGTKRLVPAIEPLLQSSHRDERDLALVTIEALNKKPELVQETVDKLVLTNGDILSGTVATPAFTIVTAYARLTLEAKEIKAVHMDVSRKRAVVDLLSGDRLSGIIQETEVKMRLATGAETTLKLDDVESITFGR